MFKTIKNWLYTYRFIRIMNHLKRFHKLDLWNDKHSCLLVSVCVVDKDISDEETVMYILKDFTFPKDAGAT